MATPRPLYRAADLTRLLHPRSIAIIGASERAGSFGERTQRNLVHFQGRVHLVNARYQSLGGLPCHASIAALPEVPDIAVVAAPMEAVEGLVQECVASGVGAAIIYAAGFAETGKADRIALQVRIAAIAREGGVRLVGPNCIGMLDYASGATISFAAVPRPAAAPGRAAVGIVSQSGNLGFALAQGVERGVAISRVLACGNSADVDVADGVAALAEDPACAAIACVFEGMADPTLWSRPQRSPGPPTSRWWSTSWPPGNRVRRRRSRIPARWPGRMPPIALPSAAPAW